MRLFRPPGQRLAGERHFDFDFVAIVEEREELIVLLLRDGIVFVRMTLGAADGQPQPHAACRGNAIKNRLNPELLLIGPAFRVGECLAMEGRGQPLVGRRVREQIAGQLLEGEPIERHVGVDGLDHPIAITPGFAAWIVFFVAVGIGIAGHVEPMTPPPLAEMRRFEQPIDQLFIRLRRRIAHKRIDQLGLGGQAEQVIRQPLDERPAVGLARRRDATRFEPGQHKTIDRAAHPRRVLHGRRHRPRDGLKGPMIGSDCAALGPTGSLIDPRRDRAHLRRRQGWGLRSRRRHPLRIVGRRDPPHDFAGLALTADQQRAGVAARQRPLAHVKPQARLLFVGPVALITMFDKNRPDVGDEVELRRLPCRDRLGRGGQLHNGNPSDRRSDQPANTTASSAPMRVHELTLRASYRVPVRPINAS